MGKKRDELLANLWRQQDLAYDLMEEYDNLPHYYGDNALYQAEAHLIDLVYEIPGITVTDLAKRLNKTPSACSQIVRKLKLKGWLEQTKNEKNNRQYNIKLTASGEIIYKEHTAFTLKCQERTFKQLKDFSDEELKHHISVQKALNKAYRSDIERSKNSGE